jgi:hypothetical protein
MPRNELVHIDKSRDRLSVRKTSDAQAVRSGVRAIQTLEIAISQQVNSVPDRGMLGKSSLERTTASRFADELHCHPSMPVGLEVLYALRYRAGSDL